jgi:hypothetical protein
MAILRHETPDGGAHFDLLLSDSTTVADDARSVPTWRCERDPFTLAPGARARVESIAPHRGLYLRLEGSRMLDGDRGRVTSVHRGWHRAQGAWRGLRDRTGAQVTLRFDGDTIVACDEASQVKAS